MFIREKGLLGGVSTEAKGIIESHKTWQTYKEGDLIFKEGEEAGHLYMLDDGKVDLLVGKQQETRFLAYYPGEVFGWSALLRPHRYLSTARCMTQSAVSRISIEAIRRILEGLPRGRHPDLPEPGRYPGQEIDRGVPGSAGGAQAGDLWWVGVDLGLLEFGQIQNYAFPRRTP